MAKYDWIELEREFTTHKKHATTSLRAFAKLKGIPYGENFKEHTEGWLTKRAAKWVQKSREMEKRTTEQQIKSAAEFNQRHLDLFDKALDAVEKILSEQMSLSTDMFGNVHDSGVYSASKLKSVVQALEIAQKAQRLALGMSDKPKDEDDDKEKDEGFVISVEDCT